MPHDRDFFRVDWDEEDADYITPLQEAALNRVAEEVVSRRMAVPVIMFLETMKPLNWMASQLMLFLEPFYAWILGFKQVIDLRRALTKREAIPMLIDKIETLENERLEMIRQRKKSKVGIFKNFLHRFRREKDDKIKP